MSYYLQAWPVVCVENERVRDCTLEKMVWRCASFDIKKHLITGTLGHFFVKLTIS